MPETVRFPLVLGLPGSGLAPAATALAGAGYRVVGATDTRVPVNESPVPDWHDLILHHFGRAWSDPRRALAMPADWWKTPETRRMRNQIETWLRPRLMSRPALADFRTSPLLPMWLDILAGLGAEPRILLCVRHPAENAAAMAETGTMSQGDAEYVWLSHTVAALRGIGRNPVCLLMHEEWQSGEAAENLRRFVLDETPLVPGLAAPANPDREPLPPALHDLYAALLSARAAMQLPHDLRLLARAFGNLGQLLSPFLDDVHLLRSQRERQVRALADLDEALRCLRDEREARLAAA